MLARFAEPSTRRRYAALRFARPDALRLSPPESGEHADAAHVSTAVQRNAVARMGRQIAWRTREASFRPKFHGSSEKPGGGSREISGGAERRAAISALFFFARV